MNINGGRSDGAAWCNLVMDHRRWAARIGCTYVRTVNLAFRGVWRVGTICINLHQQTASPVQGRQQLVRHVATILLFERSAAQTNDDTYSFRHCLNDHVFWFGSDADNDLRPLDVRGCDFQSYTRALALLDDTAPASSLRIVRGYLIRSHLSDKLEHWDNLLCVSGACKFDSIGRTISIQRGSVSYVCGSGHVEAYPGSMVT